MAPPKLTPEDTALLVEKARVVADVAEWIAFDWEDCPDKEVAAAAINAAFEALRPHSDAVLRNVVLATVKHWAELDHIGMHQPHTCQLVRSAVDHALRDKTALWRPDVKKISDRAIGEAFEAWRSNDKNLWPANAALLEELGFPRVSPDALRMAWVRQLKRA